MRLQQCSYRMLWISFFKGFSSLRLRDGKIWEVYKDAAFISTVFRIVKNDIATSNGCKEAASDEGTLMLVSNSIE